MELGPATALGKPSHGVRPGEGLEKASYGVRSCTGYDKFETVEHVTSHGVRPGLGEQPYM